MDYCHPCQRHLNGAFSCSGCGASAEECRTHPDALSAGGDTAADEHETSFEPGTTPAGPGGRRARSRGRGRGSRVAQAAPDVDELDGEATRFGHGLAGDAPDDTSEDAPDGTPEDGPRRGRG
ncbi:SCO2400 family protein, partial [Streptomyces scabiei]